MEFEKIVVSQEIDYEELSQFIHNNSQEYQLDIAGNIDLKQYMKNYYFFIYKMEEVYVGLITFKETISGVFVNDLIITSKISVEGNKLIWNDIIMEMSSYGCIMFTTYKKLFYFYKKKLKAVYLNGIFYYINGQFVVQNRKLIQCYIIRRGKNDYICLEDDFVKEYYEPSLGRIVGISKNNCELFVSLKAEKEELYLCIDNLNENIKSIQSCRTGKYLYLQNGECDKKIKISISSYDLCEEKQILYMEIECEMTVGKIRLFPTIHIDECIKNIKNNPRYLTHYNSFQEKDIRKVSYEVANGYKQRIIHNTIESFLVFFLAKDCPVIEKINFCGMEIEQSANISKWDTKGLCIPCITLKYGNVITALENEWKYLSQNSDYIIMENNFLNIDSICSIGREKKIIVYDFVIYNNRMEIVEVEIMMLYKEKEKETYKKEKRKIYPGGYVTLNFKIKIR